ncbi:DUF6052 family protein [Saccharopolyspora indica]|uniref:DUF6052 family protein n=1 Tax=Saccharopolyspora indica TaxID=1229659 RepID=UPI0022EB5C0C|nr:DUF6052 family protein [Saccharopolyspora indica]MDA3647022.1 DUF6052 family protein [Saccharopolyspora indica]
MNGELAPSQLRRLHEHYDGLRELAASCDVPAVRAAVGVAVAELRVALDGQTLDLDFYETGTADARAASAAV